MKTTQNGRNGNANGRAHTDTHTQTPLPAIAAVKLTTRNQALSAAELDNLDSAIAELDVALAERAAAASLYDDTDRKVRVIEERCRLLRLAVQVQLAAGIGE